MNRFLNNRSVNIKIIIFESMTQTVSTICELILNNNQLLPYLVSIY